MLSGCGRLGEASSIILRMIIRRLRRGLSVGLRRGRAAVLHVDEFTIIDSKRSWRPLTLVSLCRGGIVGDGDWVNIKGCGQFTTGGEIVIGDPRVASERGNMMRPSGCRRKSWFVNNDDVMYGSLN